MDQIGATLQEAPAKYSSDNANVFTRKQFWDLSETTWGSPPRTWMNTRLHPTICLRKTRVTNPTGWHEESVPGT